ncbi:MAG: tetratricopeptide repeat protein [Methanotrichaceae archaeon]|nr:tetratricopeptide repeat protein [Methanotrichaceae archaeon]
MDQLVILQVIYESFSKGMESLHSIGNSSIEGNCSILVRKLLNESRQGVIDQNLCQNLSDCLQDSYELKRLGDICRKARYFDLAIKCYQRALDSCRDQTISPILLNNLGQVYTRAGDHGRGIGYFLKALDGFEVIGDCSGTAHVMGNLASAYRRSREWDKSMEYSIKSLQTFERSGDEFGVAQMMSNMGRIYSEMGKNDIAENYFRNSLREFERLGDKRSAAWVLDRLGRICSQGGRWDESIEHFNKGLMFFEELRLDQGMVVVLSNMGRTYLEMGDFDAAMDVLSRGEELVQKDIHPAYQNFLSLLAAANSLIANKNMQEAEKAKLKAPKEGRDIQNLKLAYQHYAKASEQYHELASYSKIQIPELIVSARMSSSFSYIALLASDNRGTESISLAQKAINDLEGATAISPSHEKEQLEMIQLILKGMKEAWAMDVLGKEFASVFDSLHNSIKYLKGPTSNPQGINNCFSGVLRNLAAAINEERNKRDPSSYLGAAVSQLKFAEKFFQAYSTDQVGSSTTEIEEAVKYIEDFAAAKIDPSVMTYRGSNSLNYRAYKSALISIGWAMLFNVFWEQDVASRLFVWDEGLNLVEVRSFRTHEVDRDKKIKIKINNLDHIEKSSKSYASKEQFSKSSIQAKEIGTGGTTSLDSLVHKQKDYPIIEDGEMGSINKDVFRAKIAESFRSIAESQEARQTMLAEPQIPSPSERMQKPMGQDQEGIGQNKISNNKTAEMGGGILSRENGTKLIKAETLLVLMLLAVDLTLYLI